MLAMPLLLDTVKTQTPSEFRSTNFITIGFVNNMPDAAFEATEQQFLRLIHAASNETVVRVLLLSIPDVPRSEYWRRQLAESYRNVSELWNTCLDALIVTGAEPRTKDLRDEPYWQTLSQVVDWARINTTSTIWSCLAAHAAVLHVDGIERSELPNKLFGVFDCQLAAAHPMTTQFPAEVRVPHSRYNDLLEPALTACGYRVLTRSATAGVDMFAKQDNSLHIFLQGHPEYGATTLLREYRRDVGRFLRREREVYPTLPTGYLTQHALSVAEAFRESAIADRGEQLLAHFPMGSLAVGLDCSWHQSAIGLFGRWIEYLSHRKVEQKLGRVQSRRRRNYLYDSEYQSADVKRPRAKPFSYSSRKIFGR
jgi:homoserine O-succinyltransferase